MRLVRWLAWSVGFLFLLGTVLQLVDFFNLYKTPPDLPESLNMVEFRLAVQDYRVAVWPIFLLSNLATGIGFMAVTALGLALAGHLTSDNSHRVGIAAGLGMAGIFGAVAQLLIIGVAQPTIDNAYCDCGFKETEIVSQIWAQQLVESASRWLTNAALVLAAIGVRRPVRPSETGCRRHGTSSRGSPRSAWSRRWRFPSSRSARTSTSGFSLLSRA